MKISRTRFSASLAIGLVGIPARAGYAGPGVTASIGTNQTSSPPVWPSPAVPTTATAATACDVVTEQDASTALGTDPRLAHIKSADTTNSLHNIPGLDQAKAVATAALSRL
ncbi:MAG: hypothetical protein ABI238_04175 [Terrimesophilobacter sp.]